MAFFHFVVSAELAGQRLDQFLVSQLPQYSRSFIAEKCQTKRNGKPAKASARVVARDELELAVPALSTLTILPEEIALQVLYEDAEVLVIDKPAGMVVHPTDHGGHVTGTLVNALLGRSKSWPGEVHRPGLVHRLDRDTSGTMVIAKTEAAKLSLGEQFAKRQVTKIYLALVAGRVTSDTGRIEAPIGRDPLDRTRRQVSTLPDAKEAVSEFAVLVRYAKATLVQVQLLTGRTHQIRVHLSSLGHPVIGDTLYGYAGINEEFGLTRQFLHAHKLSFTHPSTGQRLEFEAALPKELAAVLTRLEPSAEQVESAR